MTRNYDVWNRSLHLDDVEDLTGLSDALRTWEPLLEVAHLEREALVHEPEDTLYLFWMGEDTTFSVHHREVAVRRGDVVVIPAALAVDAGPSLDGFAIRCGGTPPDHFRERFIQVWGIDHLPAPRETVGLQGFSSVISASDARHRIPYSVLDINPQAEARIVAENDPRILIGLSGRLHVIVDDLPTREEFAVEYRGAFLLGAGLSLIVRGGGRLGALTCLNEVSHEARRRDSATGVKAISPEYRRDF